MSAVIASPSTPSVNATPDRVYIFESTPWNRPWMWALLVVTVLAADFLAGPYLLFPIFYIFPVLLVAWHSRLHSALILAGVLSFARLGFQFHWGLQNGLVPALLNTAIRLLVLALLAALTVRVAIQTRELRQRVSLLEGILPICGFCKDIRDDTGEWTRLETYISHHTEAQFSHGVCEKCAREHYGPVFEQARAARATRAVFRP